MNSPQPEMPAGRDEELNRIMAKIRVQLRDGKPLPSDAVLLQRFAHLMPEFEQQLSATRNEVGAVKATAQKQKGMGKPDAGLEATVSAKPAAHSENDETLSYQQPAHTGDNTAFAAQIAARRRSSPQPCFGDYELLQEIGRGGMGVVYKARQIALNRIVAIKMIITGNLATAEDLRRFYNEAEAAARLDHPHIVKIYEISNQRGRHYFSMAFIEGRCLAQEVRQQPISARRAAEYMEKISSAIAYAHSKGVLHRDLKPANVLIDKSGQPHISDFGLAKRLDADAQLTATGQILGTPSYMPPEQATGDAKQIGERSDVYSLGAMLYFLLTGRPPFQSDSQATTLLQVITQEPVAPHLLNMAVDRDLETICLKCLEKEVTRRYESAEALHAEFVRYLNGEPIQVRPISKLTKAWRLCRRNSTVSLLALAAALLLVLGVLVSSTLAVIAARRANEAIVSAQKADDQAQRADREAALAQQEARRANLEQSKASAENVRANLEATKAKEQEARALQEAKKAYEQERLAQRRLYLSQIQLADRAWYFADVTGMNVLLDRTRPDFRGWEYDHLRWRLDHSHRTLRGHSKPVCCVAFHPDGKLLASSGDDRTILIWNLETDEVERTLRGHLRGVRQVAFSPDGNNLVSAGEDKTVRIWSVASGRELAVLNGHNGAVTDVAYGPDGRWIASSSSDHTVRVWNAASFQEQRVLSDHKQAVHSVACSPDGKWIAGGAADFSLKVWNVDTGIAKLSKPGNGWGFGASFSPDSKRVALGGSAVLKWWDLESGKEQSAGTSHTHNITSTAYSNTGEWIATASQDRMVKTWHAATGHLKSTYYGHEHIVEAVVVSPDSKVIASGARDNTVKLWAVDKQQEPQSLRGHSNVVRSATFSPDGARIVSGSEDQSARIWNAVTGEEIARLGGHDKHVTYAAFSPDGERIVTASGDQTLKLWNAASGQEIRSLRGHSATVDSAAFRFDGREIVSASHDHTIKTWDTETGEEKLTLSGHTREVRGVAYTPDGKRIVSGGEDRNVKVWDADTGKELMSLVGHDDGVSCVAVSPDGKQIASGAWNKTVIVWDAVTGDRLFTLAGHEDTVRCVTFSHDSLRIVTGGSDDGAIKIWDAILGEEVLSLPGHVGGHKGFVSSVAFSPDGRRLVSGAWDRAIKIWDAPPIK